MRARAISSTIVAAVKRLLVTWDGGPVQTTETDCWSFARLTAQAAPVSVLHPRAC